MYTQIARSQTKYKKTKIGHVTEVNTNHVYTLDGTTESAQLICGNDDVAFRVTPQPNILLSTANKPKEVFTWKNFNL